jgi:hypothetical protein
MGYYSKIIEQELEKTALSFGSGNLSRRLGMFTGKNVATHVGGGALAGGAAGAAADDENRFRGALVGALGGGLAGGGVLAGRNVMHNKGLLSAAQLKHQKGIAQRAGAKANAKASAIPAAATPKSETQAFHTADMAKEPKPTESMNKDIYREMRAAAGGG